MAKDDVQTENTRPHSDAPPGKDRTHKLHQDAKGVLVLPPGVHPRGPRAWEQETRKWLGASSDWKSWTAFLGAMGLLSFAFIRTFDLLVYVQLITAFSSWSLT